MNLYKIISKYATIVVFGVNTYMFGFSFFFGDIIVFKVCVKNGSFKSCFQPSAKGKMTALTVRSYHAFVKIFRYDCICNQNLDVQAPTLFSFPV